MFIKNLFTLIVFLSLGTALSQAQTPPAEVSVNAEEASASPVDQKSAPSSVPAAELPAEFSAPTPAGRPLPTVCVLADFGDPAKPNSPIWPSQNGTLVEGPDGSLYGATPSGGKYGRGTVYKVTLQGEITVLHDFDYTSGVQPESSLTLGPDGDLYGTALGGGEKKVGTIFKISPNGGGASVVWSFKNGWLPKLPYPQKHSDQEIKNGWPSYPTAPLVLAKGGLFGVTTYTHNQKSGMLYTTGTSKDSFSSQFYFGNEKDKENPNKGMWPNTLVAGKDGKLYGTTYTGRTPDTINGTIFASSGGSAEVIHKVNFDDGCGPTSLMMASNGNLYGTTVVGGAGRNRRFGVVFRMELPSKKFTVLHKFTLTDGAHPYGQMVEGDDGFLYGATRYGRNRSEGGLSGVIYRIHKDAPEFGSDATTGGEAPDGEDSSGGGLISRIMDLDLIAKNAFALDTPLADPAQNDRKYKIIHKFKGPDGSGPIEGLMRHSNGNFYSTTAGGGKFSRGVVYVMDTKGTPAEKLFKPGSRWCCMLGQDFAPGYGGGGGALDPETLSGHIYGLIDRGLRVLEDHDRVGYVYTAHGGLIDIGHVRDIADMTKYVYDMLMAGETSFYLYEGAVQFKRSPNSQEEALGFAGAAAYLEGWAHELTTWRMTENNQHASSFSPEDLPSNMIGIEIAKRALRGGCCKDFNKAMDEQMAIMMKTLVAKPKDITDKLIDDMEGVWFKEPIKDPTVLLRRNFGGRVWDIPFGYSRANLPYLYISTYSKYFKDMNYWVFRRIIGHENQAVTLSNMSAATTILKNEWLAEAGKGMASPP